LEPRHIRAIFLQAGVLFYLVGAAMTTSFALGQVIHNSESETIAFATPVLDVGTRWVDETGDFSSRLQAAFGLDAQVAGEYAHWILEASLRQELDPYILAGLVHAESTFRKSALSRVGAVGPAQVRPKYWAAFCGYPNLRDPEQNIHCGAQVLAHLRDRCGDDVCALKAYNVGIGATGGAAAQRYMRKIDRRRALLADQTVI